MKDKYLKLDHLSTEITEYDDAIRQDIELNKVSFEFPSGFADIPLIEECRALNDIDNFDLMYDITIQKLIGKVVCINIEDYDDKKYQLARFVVTDRYMDLRGIKIIQEFPVLVNWLVKFVSNHLKKKLPIPSMLDNDLKTEIKENEELTSQKK